MKYILAVDGGGTKTEFCVSDRKGNIIGTFLTDSTNFKSVGSRQCMENLKAGAAQIKKNLGIPAEDFLYSVFGISGCDSPEDRILLKELICEAGFKEKKFYLCNDSVLAYYAQAEEPGIVVISGTGSIILGIDSGRNMKRAGGWGYNISDVGSGYWLGNELLKRTLLYCDGFGEGSELFEAVRKEFGIESFEELPYKIMECTSYQDVARLSQILIRQYDRKNREAVQIVERGMDELADMAAHVYGHLHFSTEKKISLVLSGGVMKNKSVQNLFYVLFIRKVQNDNIDLQVQQHQPAYGGLKLAEHILEGNEFHE